MMKQYGAIPFIRKEGGIQVVLITSASGCWIFPKGCYQNQLGKHGTAQQEAMEEAGVEGNLLRNNAYRCKVLIKNGERGLLTLYALEVKTIANTWQEEERRKRKIVTIDEAEKLLSSDALISCLRKFERDMVL